MKTSLVRLTGLRRGDWRQARSLFLTTACSLIAASALADTKLVTDGSPARILVPQNGDLGGTWRSPSFNDSSWMAGQNGVGYEVNPGAFSATVIADSRAEFSAGGQQGENSWINGYYDKFNDADGTYQANDFQPFPRNDGPWAADNFWTGGAWDWFAGDPPWDNIGASDVHPNGDNNGGEHWVIRRWHSTATGNITILFHVRKTNLNGTGTTGKIFKNGVEIFTRAIPGNDGTGFSVYVNTTAAPGDVFDFAHTPVGVGGDTADGADGSIMTATVLSGTITPPPPPVEPTRLADSAADWSSTGVQGANNWYYGYYNRTADADAAYDPNTDFNMTDPNWTFTGGNWVLGVDGNPGANPPWDTIGQSSWHPNGSNQPQGIHWVIRRWVAEADGQMHARVRFAKSNTSGNGTTLHVLHNGTEVYSVALNNTAGVDTFVNFPSVFVGDKIEFALDPTGVDGGTGDGSDSSTFTGSIFTGPPPQTVLADSVAEWSTTGVQGANGWYYGFYNETLDADGTYNSGTDFNTTDPNWTFTGGAWQLGAAGNPGANPPWDTIAQTDWHPNGINNTEVHWVIKRWVSDVDGVMHARVQFGKQNVNGGNGTTLRILHNGNQVFSHTVAFNNGTGINTNVALSEVFIGDTIEFALDPLGTDGTKNDGADGSYLRASILAGPAPQPPRPFVPGIADCFQTDIETAMKGVNPSVFIRIPFDVTDPAAIETLKLKLKYNDGFAAYLNGTEIAKRNAPTTIAGITVADSIADWSTNPDVTVNGWSYGYYSQSLDPDGVYSGGSDMTAFPHDGGGHSATDFWTGSGYDWFAGNPPWTELFQETTHPNHPNGGAVDPANPATHLHWVVRRWSATVDANLKARIRFRKTNPNCGDGVRVVVFHNSVQVYSQTLAFNDATGRDDTIDLPDVFIGDNIDLLLGPGDGNDFCDGSAFSMVLFEGEPTIPWNGTATATRTPTETIAPTVFDISSFISELQPGQNVLAIQGFNAGISDNEFVINAELLANRIPTAANDTVAAATDTPTVYPGSALLGNDSDSDGDALLLVGVTPSYMTSQGGSVRLYGNTVHYTPPAGFTGTDTFNYTITDLSGVPVRALVTVNVARPNVCPTASPLNVAVDQDGSGSFQLPANDANGDALQYIVTQPPAHGVVVVQTGTGAATYTPAARYCGPDSFSFKVSDGQCESEVATVAINVINCNECPIASNLSVTAEEDTPASFQLPATDADGNALQYSVTQPPVNGTVVVEALTGAATYTPASGFCDGTDTFKFRVSDGRCQSAEATVSISVECRNEPPTGCLAAIVPAECVITALDGTLMAISVNGSDACITLQGSATDPEGESVLYSWSTNGVPFAAGGVVTNCFPLGCHTATFTATDPRNDSCSALLDFCVVTPGEAVEHCIVLVEQTSVERKNKRPLIATLKAAAAAFDRGSYEAALNNLHAFQNKVRAQIGGANPAAAQAFTDAAQKIMEAFACSAIIATEGGE